MSECLWKTSKVINNWVEIQWVTSIDIAVKYPLILSKSQEDQNYITEGQAVHVDTWAPVISMFFWRHIGWVNQSIVFLEIDNSIDFAQNLYNSEQLCGSRILK